MEVVVTAADMVELACMVEEAMVVVLIQVSTFMEVVAWVLEYMEAMARLEDVTVV
jgi:hypothetical protein